MSAWQPFFQAYSGLLHPDPRMRNVPPHKVEPFQNRPGEVVVIRTAFFARIESVTAALAAAKVRFDKHMDAIRAELRTTQEYQRWNQAANNRRQVQATAAGMRPKLAQAEGQLGKLVVGATDKEYGTALESTAAYRDRLARLQTEDATAAQTLPALETALASKAVEIASAKAAAAQADIATETDELCGLLRNEENALDRLLELDAFSGHLCTSLANNQLAKIIVSEIVAENRQHAAAPPAMSNPFAAGRDVPVTRL